MFSLFEILGQESLKKMVAQNNRKIIEFLYQNQSFFSYNVEVLWLSMHSLCTSILFILHLQLLYLLKLITEYKNSSKKDLFLFYFRQ
jgi:hypothetical protein